MQRADAPEEAPTFGGFRLRGLIGTGAVGEVHRAVGEDGRTLVALKLVPLAPGSGAQEQRQRFAAEVAAAARLRHPDIVRVHATGVDGDRGWIAMELLAGCDLVRYTRPARLLPEAVVLRVGERIARALAYAHTQGIVHRDVKPGNVMVDWAADRVTLTDFGIANLADGERTRTGLVLGTPGYMAPEQLAGSAAGAAGDLYALGVMLFELLTGRLPFEASTLGDLLRRVATDPAPDLGPLRPDLPPEIGPPLAQLLAALLAKQPADRPPDAAAVADRLSGLGTALEGVRGGPKSRR